LKSKVGIVVPTLGKRPEYLAQCLKSIKRATLGTSSAHVVLVGSSGFNPEHLLSEGLVDSYVLDPGTGLAGAINAGMNSMPNHIEFVNWLGDDDLLVEKSLDIATTALESDPKAVLVFGGCDYVDAKGNLIWKNSSGAWAVPLLRFGPDLIPQPGALFRLSTFREIGGLDMSYSWAFDFDFLIKLSKRGKLTHLSSTLSNFRWHPESLSVEHRKMSVTEASRVRVSHLPKPLKTVSWIWEPLVRLLTLVAGNRVSSRSRKKEIDR
jgi:hypothetical protein